LVKIYGVSIIIGPIGGYQKITIHSNNATEFVVEIQEEV
jgi:hypothetical protein